MTKEETTYLENGRNIVGTAESQRFGKPFFTIGGKADGNGRTRPL